MGKKLKKERCEICGCADIETLEEHHILERGKIGSSNSWLNISIICSNCHSRIHRGSLKIIGIFPSTQLPNGRTVVFEENGKCSVDGINDKYFEEQSKGMKVI